MKPLENLNGEGTITPDARFPLVTSPLTKTELRLTETNRAARAIIAEERARHIAKTAKLREIRLTQAEPNAKPAKQAGRRSKGG